MAASYCFQTAYTVASSYTWDVGVPFSSNTPLLSTVATLNGTTIRGYSPGVRVTLNNTSTQTNITDPPPATNKKSLSSLYVWNFGDFYNHKNNITTLSCASAVSHTYIMPGDYNITLTVTELISSSNPVEGIYTDTTTFNSLKVNVLDVSKPVALMHSITQPVYGQSPRTVTITARGSKAGSFPIDRIDWDLNDGSPIYTVTRYTSAYENFEHTNSFTDLADPRNYDIIHTYKLKSNSSQTFYPSITAYSSSTYSYDACSLTIGPLTLPETSNNVHILKVRNTPKGKIYGLQIGNNIALLTTLSSNNINNNVTVNIPTNPIRDSFNTLVGYTSSGNSGTDYFSVTAKC
jgi:hypothetical protein